MKSWRNCFSGCRAAQARGKAIQTFNGRLRAFLICFFNANANKSDRSGPQHFSHTFPIFSPLPPHSVSLPPRSLAAFSARAVHSSLRERASGGWLGDSPTPAASPLRALLKTPGAIFALAQSLLCAQKARLGSARRRGRASVPPPGRPARGFDNRASRAMIRPSLLRCLRKAQAFGRRWG